MKTRVTVDCCTQREREEMMEPYDRVKIKSSRITGIIVDAFNGRYTVEADGRTKTGDNSGYPGQWLLYTRSAAEIKPII